MSEFDWEAIRLMYESGESPAHIEKLEGMPSRQAIHKKANREGWQVVDEISEDLALIPFEGLTDTQRYVVAQVGQGATQRMAAALAGVHETTVSDWKKDNEKFAKAILAAKAAKARKRLSKIEDAKDWRAALALLERDPDSREEWAPPNAMKGVMTGNTFNVLGQVSLGFERGDYQRLPEGGEQPAPALIGRDGNE